MRTWFELIVMVSIALATVAQPRVEVSVGAKLAPRLAKVEFTIGIEGRHDNPYDPDEVDVVVELTSPSGAKFSQPAFYFQPFERKPLSRGGNNNEWLYPVGKGIWMARFAPTETGTYSAVAVAKDRLGAGRSDAVRFDCTPSTSRGCVRVSKKDPRYLEMDDGSPFFAVGQNVAFVYDSYATAEKLRKLGDNGANFARVWACAEDWALSIEARRSAWGRSWDWRPPIVLMPDREGYHSGRLCLRISGEAGASITAQPSHPVAVKPATRYALSGLFRTERGVDVAVDLAGKRTLTGKPGWTKFREEFTTSPNQQWLGDLRFSISARGAAWLAELSLTEAGGGPELLWEADPNRPAVGVYNQPDCFMLDQVVEAAERHNVYLQMVLLTRDHYMRLLDRDGSPEYQRATTAARKLFRYAIARWGYSTHVAAWEVFNEMDPGKPTDAFYAHLAAAVGQFDANRHMLANSTWSVPAKDHRHPGLSTADMHFYLRPANGETWKDEAASVLARWKAISPQLANRPLIFSEFGITDNNWQHAPELNKDTKYVHLHNALWASAMSGYASTVCHWYWDDIHQRDLYGLYRPISRFVADIPWTTARLKTAAASCDKGVRIIGLSGERQAYLWLQDEKATWWNIVMENLSPRQIAGATLTLDGLPAGDYRVEWWDTREGKPVRTDAVNAHDGKCGLSVPAFSGDIACKLRPAK